MTTRKPDDAAVREAIEQGANALEFVAGNGACKVRDKHADALRAWLASGLSDGERATVRAIGKEMKDRTLFDDYVCSRTNSCIRSR